MSITPASIRLFVASEALNTASRDLLAAWYADHITTATSRCDTAMRHIHQALAELGLTAVETSLLEQLKCQSNPPQPTVDAPASTTSPTNAAEPTASGSTASETSASSTCSSEGTVSQGQPTADPMSLILSHLSTPPNSAGSTEMASLGLAYLQTMLKD